MMSFQLPIDARKRKAGRFISTVRRELQRAYVEEQQAARGRGEKLTQARLARLLGVHRSVVNRSLTGTGDLTLRTIADLAWALDRTIVFRLEDRSAQQTDGGNHRDAGDRAPPFAGPPVQTRINPALTAVPMPTERRRIGSL